MKENKLLLSAILKNRVFGMEKLLAAETTENPSDDCNGGKGHCFPNPASHANNIRFLSAPHIYCPIRPPVCTTL
jgi:hypothetical protein